MPLELLLVDRGAHRSLARRTHPLIKLALRACWGHSFDGRDRQTNTRRRRADFMDWSSLLRRVFLPTDIVALQVIV